MENAVVASFLIAIRRIKLPLTISTGLVGALKKAVGAEVHDDFDTNLAAQDRFLQLLGTPADRKKHVALDGAHVASDWHAVIREVLDWSDQWLGPENGDRHPTSDC